MRRVLLLAFVSFIALGVSGLSGLVVPEPCGLQEAGPESSAPCSPTCVQCGCCAQPVVGIATPVDVLEDAQVPHASTLPTRLAQFSPRDVFHVPKPILL